MSKFTDNKGLEWTITVNVNTLKRVKSALSVDLLDVAGGPLLQQIFSDPILLCDVIYVVCQPQADENKITDEQFGERLGGDSIEHATAALLEGLTDFFPRKRRQVLKKAIARCQELEAEILDEAERRIKGPEIKAEIEKKMGRPIFGEPSTSSPESAE